MKTKTVLHTLFAAGVLLCSSPVQAGHESSTVARHIATLESLASGMVAEFRENLRERHRHYGPSRAERQLLASLGHLAETSCMMRRAVDSRVAVCDLERGFAAMERAFECVEDSADEVEVCSCLQGMMNRFEDTTERVEDTGFECVARPVPTHQHQHRHGTEHDEGHRGSTGGLRIPLPPGFPFEFRAPFSGR